MSRLLTGISYFQFDPDLPELINNLETDFGEAPNYNKAYWAIRHVEPLLRDTVRPTWLLQMRDRIRKQQTGYYNYLGTQNNGRFSYIKKDTRRNLIGDLTRCMRYNIPFKTKSIRFDNKTGWVSVYGINRLFYDFTRGIITKFTYGGHYNKFVNVIFRELGILVKVINKVPNFIYMQHVSTPNIGYWQDAYLSLNIHSVYENVNDEGKYVKGTKVINSKTATRWVLAEIHRLGTPGEDISNITVEELLRRNPIDKKGEIRILDQERDRLRGINIETQPTRIRGHSRIGRIIVDDIT